MPIETLTIVALALLAAQQASPLPSGGPSERLPVAWSTDVGAGFARPVVVGDVVHLLTRGDGAALVTLAATDGRVLWRAPIQDEPRPGQEEMGGRAPHADPLPIGDSVLALGFGGSLTSVGTADGALRWRVDIVEALGARPVQFGFAASPIVVDETVVVAAGAPGPGYVALEPATGAVLWSSAPYASSYVTPVLATIEGARQLVCVTGDETVGLDPTNGQELWRLPHVQGGLTNFASIHVAGDGGVLVSGQGLRGLRCIDVARVPADNGGRGGWSARERWLARRAQLSHGRAVELDGRLYASTSAQLVQVDQVSGRLGFSLRRFAPCTLTAVGPLTALLEEDGDLSLVRLAPDRIVVHARVALAMERAWVAPVVAGDRLLVRVGTRVVAFGLPAPGAPGAPLEVIETGGAPAALVEVIEPAADAEPFVWSESQRARVLGAWTLDGGARVEFSEASGVLSARSDVHPGVEFTVAPESSTRAWIRALDAPYGIATLRLEVPNEATPSALRLHQGVDEYVLTRAAR